MKFYLVRHGQTDWNKLLKIQGQIDNPLNATGEREAKDISSFFKAIQPDALYSTSLKRAKTTLNIIKQNNEWNLPININDSFIERDFGEIEGIDVHQYKKIYDFSNIQGYEQDTVLEERVVNGLRNLSKNDMQKQIIVCHSHVIKAALINLFGGEKFESYTSFSLPNCCIVEINYINDTFELVDIH